MPQSSPNEDAATAVSGAYKDDDSNEDFYVMNGNRILIKREKFEKYLDQATTV